MFAKWLPKCTIILQQANRKVMQPMVTRCSVSIALWKRLMKPNLNALYFQEVTLPV